MEEKKLHGKPENYMFFNMDGIENLELLERLQDLNTFDKVTKYLPIKFKKMWFLSKYPNGVIRYEINHTEPEFAIVTAKLYHDCSFPQEQYSAEAVGIVDQHMLKEIILSPQIKAAKLVQLAKGLAATHALTEAGFGLQFYELEDETDPETLQNKENSEEKNQQFTVKDRLENDSFSKETEDCLQETEKTNPLENSSAKKKETAVSAKQQKEKKIAEKPQSTPGKTEEKDVSQYSSTAIEKSEEVENNTNQSFLIGDVELTFPKAAETESKEANVLQTTTKLQQARMTLAKYGIQAKGVPLSELEKTPQLIAFQYVSAEKNQDMELMEACRVIAQNNPAVEDMFLNNGIDFSVKNVDVVS